MIPEQNRSAICSLFTKECIKADNSVKPFCNQFQKGRGIRDPPKIQELKREKHNRREKKEREREEKKS